MSKQAYRIEDFSGGLNRSSDPRDIADNESAILWGWNIDDGGVIKLSGGQALPSYGPQRAANENVSAKVVKNSMAGFGLSTFASDYKPNAFPDDELLAAEERTEYILQANEYGYIDMYHIQEAISSSVSQEDSVNFEENFISLGGRGESVSLKDGNPKVKYYIADGGIRIYDTDWTHKYNSNKSFMFVNRKFMQNAIGLHYNSDGELSERILLKDFKFGSASIVQEGSYTYSPSGTDISTMFNVKRWVAGHAHLDTEPPYDGSSVGWDAGYSDGADSGDALNGIIARPNMYVGHTYVGTGNNSGKELGNRFKYDARNNQETDLIGNGYKVKFGGSGLGGKVCLERYGTSGGAVEDDGIKKRWSFWYAFEYDETNITTLQAVVRSNGKPFIEDNFENLTHNYEYRVSFAMCPFGDMATHGSFRDTTFSQAVNRRLEGYKGADFVWNPRITKCKIFIKEVDPNQPYSTTSGNDCYSNEGDGEHLLWLDMDLQDGTYNFKGNSEKDYGESFNYSVTTIQNGSGKTIAVPYFFVSNVLEFKTLPSISFESIYGYNGTKPQYQKYKTACILNRRVYIGNVCTLDNAYYKKPQENFDDRMVKSPVNAFDTFPYDNFVDVAINDGDAIVHLEGYNDRILQFKEKVLYIINVSQDFEFLESSHPHMGIKFHGQVCKTPYGIAWINDKGCYFYDGKGIKNLIDGKIKQGRPIEFKDGDRGVDNSANDEVINATYLNALFDDEGTLAWAGGDYSSKYHQYLGWGAFMNSQLENIQNYENKFQRQSMPSIGYDATSEKLIIIKSLNSKGYDNVTSWVFAYNLKKQSWTSHPYSYYHTAENANKTNFINNKKGELILYQSANFANTNMEPTINNTTDAYGFYKWSNSRENREVSHWSDNTLRDLIWYRSKDIIFDNASSKKNVFSVHITYRCSADTNIQASFLTNGFRGKIDDFNNYRTKSANLFLTSKETNKAGNPFYTDSFKNTSGRWEKVVLKPSNASVSKGIYSFQLQMHNASPETKQPDDFAINDISIIYRSKGTHFEKGE